jgi:hypothetical protein
MSACATIAEGHKAVDKQQFSTVMAMRDGT